MIPAFNEEQTLPVALQDIPKNIKGIDEVETLIINDGSSDNTINVAKNLGVNHYVNFKRNQGLAKVFQAGLKKAISVGADVIVNYDADNQYRGGSIEALVQPILNNSADIVIGSRPIDEIAHFGFIKKKLQRLGSRVVQHFSETDIPDVTSGFRAFNREAVYKLVVVSDFTYTLETIIQAKGKGLAVSHVPIEVNKEVLRKSRLFKNSRQYIIRSIDTIFRIYFMYNLFKVLRSLGLLSFIVASGISLRFLYLFLTVAPGVKVGHTQSLILASILYILGVFMMVVSFIADLVHHNRKLSEEILYYQRKHEI